MARKDGQPETRGGKRPGSGPKKKTRVYSDRIKDDLIRALKKQAKEHKRTWLDELAALAYAETTMQNAKLGAMKLVAEILVVKESHKTVETQALGIVHIPPEDPVVVEDAAQVLQ